MLMPMPLPFAMVRGAKKEVDGLRVVALQSAKVWLKSNELKLNADKTHVCYVSRIHCGCFFNFLFC